MNKVILMGRLTRDPEVRYSTSGDSQLAIARYTLAVDRRFKRDGEQTADFIRCVAFGRSGEFAEKYFHQGTKIVAEGRIQTGSYQDKDGKTVYTTEVVVENQEFAESKATSDNNAGFAQAPAASAPTAPAGDGFVSSYTREGPGPGTRSTAPRFPGTASFSASRPQASQGYPFLKVRRQRTTLEGRGIRNGASLRYSS